MGTKKILTANLKPGMISAEAAYTYTNHLVIQSNTILTDEIIEKLKYYAVKAVKIQVNENSPEDAIAQEVAAANRSAVIDGPTYFERVQNSPEFKKFESEFTGCVDSFKTSLNDMVTKSSDGLVDNMLNDVKILLSKSRNPLHLLDMMQCMRGFDDLTYAHSMNVALICDVIGTWLHLSDDDLNILLTAGLLHDVGKLKIPSEIIKKPGKLTDSEFEIIKQHPKLGYDILKPMDLDERIKLAALQHHERFNGKGYPSRLTKSEIGFFSSIVAVADVYDAMTSNRVYRKGICPFPVLEQLESDKDLYEPSVLYLFLERTVEAYINTEVLLSNNMRAKVVLSNKTFLSRPVVLGENNVTYDLSKHRDLEILALI